MAGGFGRGCIDYHMAEQQWRVYIDFASFNHFDHYQRNDENRPNPENPRKVNRVGFASGSGCR